jgi:hypothetical protein
LVGVPDPTGSIPERPRNPFEIAIQNRRRKPACTTMRKRPLATNCPLPPYRASSSAARFKNRRVLIEIRINENGRLLQQETAIK